MSLKVLDLFSAAAGGWSLGMHRAGFTTIAACEAVDWRRALYAQNNPGVPIYDDVRTLTADRLLRDIGELPSVIVGSPPCQDISSANTKGRGVEGERSGIYFEAVRIIGECRPRWFALENSANLRTKGADAVLAALEALGYACWAFVVRASDVGANHERPRSWLIGCDLAQVADPNGDGRDARWSGRWLGSDLSVSDDNLDAAGIRHEGGRTRRYGADGDGAAYAGNPAQDGRGPGLSGRHPGTTGRAEQSPCGDAADSSQIGCLARPGNDEGSRREIDRHELADGAAPGGADCNAAYADEGREHASSVDGEMAVVRGLVGDSEPRETPDPDQARQAHGCMESGLRQAEIADDGCGDGRGADRPGIGQMGLCQDDRGDPDESWPLWSLDDLAARIRLDDGLPARVAGTRVAVGGPRGTVAASLIVEAYGDAVIPQIPEAIGRAFLRVERAMMEVAA